MDVARFFTYASVRIVLRTGPGGIFTCWFSTRFIEEESEVTAAVFG
jgi:hypothetical protein